jgi:hypothetical protein
MAKAQLEAAAEAQVALEELLFMKRNLCDIND